MLDPHLEYLDGEDSAIRCFHRECADLADDHTWHFHPQFELACMVQGSGTRFVGDQIEQFVAGDLVLLGPNLPHCWQNEALGGNDRTEWMVAHFAPDCPSFKFLDVPEAGPVLKMFDEAVRGIAFLEGTGSIIAPLLRELIEFTGLRQIIKLAEILELLSRSPRMPLATVNYREVISVDDHLVETLKTVERYITQNFRGEVQQSEIAAKLGMSPSGFSKLMKNATGRTFTSMIKFKRINEARKLLAAGDVRVSDVAFDCGYQHPSHFDRHFRELLGISPSEYRRQMKAMAFCGENLGRKLR